MLAAKLRTRRTRSLPVLPAAALIAAILAVTAAPAQALTAPPGNAFYTPPSPLPAGSPGDIIWSRSSPSPLSYANAWQVLYLSTTALGQPTEVSGTVIVPTSPYPGMRPLVAYAAGTQGWGDQCAPSQEIAAGSFDEEFAVSNLLNKGWAVVLTDYPGLGTPGDEAYNIGIPEGYAVLDSLRAALKLPAAGLSAATPLGIEGYSQGGGAADWAAQLQPSYAPDLHLAGVAAGGTPANLQAVAANINGTAWTAFLLGTAIGFNAAYPDLNLKQYLTPAGRAAWNQLDSQCQVEALLTFAGKRIEDYTIGGTNPINTPAVQAVLNQNDLGAIRPAAPLLQYHGLADEIIPWSVESKLHSQYCAAGVKTQLNGYVADHVLTQVVAQADVVNWLASRLTGSPAPSNC
ncbi:MAG: lipase family protein [Micromonosporaceae bacterium]